MSEKKEQGVIETPQQNQNKKFSFSNFLVILLCIATFCFLIFNVLFVRVEVYGESMENTLNNGDKVFIARYGQVDYGSVVVIEGENAKEWIIKRVIAKSGDTVKIENGYVFLKKAGQTEFTQINETYIKEQGKTFCYDDDKHPITDGKEFIVPQGELFYLGDNRQNSTDSRSEYFTCSETQVVGVLCNWSLTNN